jgi:hypothetical protein
VEVGKSGGGTVDGSADGVAFSAVVVGAGVVVAIEVALMESVVIVAGTGVSAGSVELPTESGGPAVAVVGGVVVVWASGVAELDGGDGAADVSVTNVEGAAEVAAPVVLVALSVEDSS